MFSNISQLSQKNTSVAAFFNKVLWGFKEAFQSTVTRLDSGHLRVLIIFPSLRAAHYWVAVQQRLSHLGLNILSAIQGMGYPLLGGFTVQVISYFTVASLKCFFVTAVLLFPQYHSLFSISKYYAS